MQENYDLTEYNVSSYLLSEVWLILSIKFVYNDSILNASSPRGFDTTQIYPPISLEWHTFRYYLSFVINNSLFNARLAVACDKLGILHVILWQCVIFLYNSKLFSHARFNPYLLRLLYIWQVTLDSRIKSVKLYQWCCSSFNNTPWGCCSLRVLLLEGILLSRFVVWYTDKRLGYQIDINRLPLILYCLIADYRVMKMGLLDSKLSHWVLFLSCCNNLIRLVWLVVSLPLQRFG